MSLSELADCAGLSSAQRRNILRHDHASNNRALLFSLACSMVIHCLDFSWKKTLAWLKKCSSTVIWERNASLQKKTTLFTSSAKSNTYKQGLASNTFSNDPGYVITIGARLFEAVEKKLGNSPNGNHFVDTMLVSTLLPTVEFHVLFRTGNTDVPKAFRFRLTYILHSSNHLKYQELPIFYAFLRGVMPDAVTDELHTQTPGSCVVKLLSFTSGNRHAMDLRGWTYVHQDELLESVMVRHI